jgi:hypothetical protein
MPEFAFCMPEFAFCMPEFAFASERVVEWAYNCSSP